MKRQLRFFNSDPSRESVTLLHEKVKKYLKDEHGISKTWCPDFPEWYDHSSSEVLDIVFFGDYLKKFLELHLNPIKEYRFWVLSEAVKNSLIDLYFIPEEKIGIIPRYKLYPLSEKALSIDTSKPIKLIYSGQLRREKGILLLLNTVFRLQTDYNLNIQLELFGNFFLPKTQDEERIQFQQKVMHLLDTLPWSVKPVLHGYRPNEFLDGENQIYINLSHFMSEDFNTSLAKAQELGIPCIVSNWGAHKDISGSFLKIPYELCCESEAYLFESHYRSIGVADFIASNLNTFSKGSAEKANPVQPPKKISKAEVLNLHQKIAERWDPVPYFILRRHLSFILDFTRGHEFEANHVQLFAHKRKLPLLIVVVNNLDEKLDGVKIKLDACNWKKMFKENEVQFFQIKDLQEKEYSAQLFHAHKVIVPEAFKKIPSFNSLLGTLAQTPVEIDYV